MIFPKGAIAVDVPSLEILISFRILPFILLTYFLREAGREVGVIIKI